MRRPLGRPAGRRRAALNEICHLRKDWDRISPGLADLAIQRGWQPEDGSKLDFSGALRPTAALALGYRWWGLATMLLEQQNGSVDHAVMRRLLGEPAADPEARPTATAGLVAQVGQILRKPCQPRAAIYIQIATNQ